MIYYDPALAFYILAFLFLLLHYYMDKKVLQSVYKSAMALAVLLNVIHLVHMVILNPLYTVQSLFISVSSAIAIICLLFGFNEKRLYIGLILLPAIIISGLLSIIFAGDTVKSKAMESMHIPLIVIGIALLLTAFAAGLMYVALGDALKNKRFSRVFERLPSLTSIEKTGNIAAYLGFAFYSAGMFAAIAWTGMRYNSLEPFMGSFYLKIAVSTLVWAFAGGFILIRKQFTITIKRAAYMSFAGITGISAIITAVVMSMFRI